MKMLKLIILQLKVNFGLSAWRWYLKNDLKRFLGGVGLLVLIVVSIAPIFFLYLRLLDEFYAVAAYLGQPELVLAFTLVLSSILVLVFSLSFVMSVFYFSRDLSLLVPLPLLPREILGAKFSVVLLYEYLTVAPFFFPALWIYGANTGAGPGYWVAGAALFLLVPVIPLAISSTLILLLMRVTNLSRRRDTLQMIGLFAFIAIVLLFNVFIGGISAGEEADFIERVILGEQGLLELTTRAYPPALFATRALAGRGEEATINFAYYLGISLAGVALILFIGQRIYYQGLIGSAEVRGGKALSRDTLARKTAGASSPVWAIAMREIKYLVRTPIYLFNSLAMLAVVPLIMLIPPLSEGSLGELFAQLQGAVPRVAQIMGIAGFIGLMALFTPAASSSFSREGKLFWISQVIPVSARQQICGKLLYSYLIAALSMPVAIIISVVILPLSFSGLLLALLAGLVLSFPAISVSLLVDLLRPYLTWDSPQKAIKQNINVLVGIVAGGALYYLLYLAGRAVYDATGANLPVYAVVLGGAILSGTVFYSVLVKIAPGRYRDLEI